MSPDEYEARLEATLDRMVREAMDEFIDGLSEEALAAWTNEDDDAKDAELREELTEQAETELEEDLEANTPCCNDFYCPCGGGSRGGRR